MLVTLSTKRVYVIAASAHADDSCARVVDYDDDNAIDTAKKRFVAFVKFFLLCFVQDLARISDPFYTCNAIVLCPLPLIYVRSSELRAYPPNVIPQIVLIIRNFVGLLCC